VAVAVNHLVLLRIYPVAKTATATATATQKVPLFTKKTRSADTMSPLH